jgi:hypothetical protein
MWTKLSTFFHLIEQVQELGVKRADDPTALRESKARDPLQLVGVQWSLLFIAADETEYGSWK